MAPRSRASALLLAGAACLADSEGRSPATCHATGECPVVGRGVAGTGFTNNTGWAADGSGCCDICEGAKRVNCFDQAACGSKTGEQGDWDFAVLDQIWLPQFCRALTEGHDPTLTHMPSERCLEGAVRRSGLSIHGLWPNYVGGFPQCCRRVALPQDLHETTVQRAKSEWVDPTTVAGDGCGVCKMWGHEMMKHGTCLTTSMEAYMRVSLDLLARLEEQTAAANKLLSSASNSPVRRRELEDIFRPYGVRAVCDPRDSRSRSSVGVFLELQTCWNRTSAASARVEEASDLVQVDCPRRAVRDACPELVLAINSQGEDLAIAV